MAVQTSPVTPFYQTVDTVQQFRIGVRIKDYQGREWTYLKGVASTIAGTVVTYDESGVTTLLAANAVGPVGIAGAAVLVNLFGWYGIFGGFTADVVANCADNAAVGRETTDGKIGDGFASGDQIFGAVSRGATTTAALAPVQVTYPYVGNTA